MAPNSMSRTTRGSTLLGISPLASASFDHVDEDRGVAAIELLDRRAAIVAGDPHFRDEQAAKISLGDEGGKMLADQNVKLLAKAFAAAPLWRPDPR